MKKKISATLLTAITAVSLTACGGNSAAVTTSGATAAQKDTASASTKETAVSEALSDGVLTVGTNAAFPPFEYVGDDGNPDGFDIALIKAIGEEMGVKVEISDMEFDSLVASIGNKVDVAIAGMTITDERKDAVDFSDPYYDAVQYVLVSKDSDISSYDDLKGKAIGSQLGTTGDFICEDLVSEDASTTASTYDKGVDAVNDLINGRLDAVILDKNPALVFAEQYDSISALDGTDFGFETEQYAIAIPKGDDALTSAINDALATLKENGTYDKLVAEYIEN